MFRYRIMIILAVIWLSLALNLERPDDLFGLGNLNINSFVYVIGAAVMVVLLAFLRLDELRTYVLSIPVLVVYGIVKVITYDNGGDAGRFTYLTLIELLGLLLTIWIVQQLGRSINQFNLTIEESLIQQDKGQVIGTLEGETIIRRKIDQARRFDRQLALLYIHLDESGNGMRRQLNQKEKVRYMYLQTQLAELMTYLVKVSDIRVWHRSNMVVCMLDASPENSVATAQQVQQVLKDVLGLQARIGVGNFPDDGLIYQHLLKTAMDNIITD